MLNAHIVRHGGVGVLVALMAVSTGTAHAQAPLGEPVDLEGMKRRLEAESDKLHELERALVERIDHMVAGSEFKRQVPPIAKIGPRTAGIDYLYPRRRPRSARV